MNEHARLPASLFDDFVADRPAEERWELIEGSFVMQAQPSFDHQIIARNIERLLNDGLESIEAARFALQNPTIDLTPVVLGSKYVPDVAVLDSADLEPGRHMTTTCYLAAEVVSPSDRRAIVRRGPKRIEIKKDSYAKLPGCEAILIVEQDRYAAEIGLRVGEDWTWTTRTDRADEIHLPGFGLRCPLGAFYARTSLAAGKTTRRKR